MRFDWGICSRILHSKSKKTTMASNVYTFLSVTTNTTGIRSNLVVLRMYIMVRIKVLQFVTNATESGVLIDFTVG